MKILGGQVEKPGKYEGRQTVCEKSQQNILCTLEA